MNGREDGSYLFAPGPVFNHKPSKLTPQQWDELSERYHNGEKTMDLALEYGVSAATIRGRYNRS